MDDLGVVWPKRAVVTAGMPYGNKPLHFGHIGGVFIPADMFARFLRDRIGRENVRFVSGTDCFGSPINEGYRKAVENDGFEGTIEDYVSMNHMRQAEVLESFDVDLDIFEGSGIGHSGEVHQEISYAFINALHEQGHLHLESTEQFYDEVANTFLNGRQVIGKCCPVQGCKAEHAYADECDLGHQYNPADLMDPISTISNTRPVMRSVKNWYFDLQNFGGFLKQYVKDQSEDDGIREIVPTTISEFLGAPIIFVKNEAYDDYLKIAESLPSHTYREAEGGKSSFELQFNSIEDRDVARRELEKSGIRFRTSKTLVPFRITGNIEWGVKAPVIDGVEDLTVWCWPESLWAPISFTIAANDDLGLPRNVWRDFWCSEDSCIYQFIGQDNIYFYGVAQPAMWHALGKHGFGGDEAKPLRQTNLVANYHLLFGKTKASSSGTVTPPSADDLLNHYTPQQLRTHFLALGLDQKAVPFRPKPFDPALDEDKRQDNRVSDPVLKEGVLLTNVYNRLARSCLYESKNNFDCYMPLGETTEEVMHRAKETLSKYERLMHKVELHSVIQLADEFIRFASKWWASGMEKAANAEKEGLENASDIRRQVMLDSYYLLRVATLMMHPVVPKGTELICDYLNFDKSVFFSWDHDFVSNDEICTAIEINEGRHMVLELPQRFDFFKKHESQYK